MKRANKGITAAPMSPMERKEHCLELCVRKHKNGPPKVHIQLGRRSIENTMQKKCQFTFAL